MRKYGHLQVLRAVAASLVVIEHTLAAMPHGARAQRFAATGDAASMAGIDAFFMLSGVVMTLQARQSFGHWRNAGIFLYRRVIRIVPMYWIATAAWLLRSSWMHWPTDHRRAQVLFSLGFIPNLMSSDRHRLLPLVPPGWTLNYEMAFYGMFATALLLRRRIGMTVLAVLPFVLVLVGQLGRFPVERSLGALAGFYTDPWILMFGKGVVLAWIVSELREIPSLRLPFSPAFLLPVPTLLMLAFPDSIGQAPLWDSLITLSMVVVTLCLFTQEPKPSWWMRALVLLGDASYSTYLFHPFVVWWMPNLIAKVTTRLHLDTGTPWVLLLSAVVVANATGVLIHLLVERPMTRLLRRIKVGSREMARESVAVGA